MKEIILAALRFAKERMKNNFDGHDYYHAERVYKKAVQLADKEQANVFITCLAAILHDIDNVSVLETQNDTNDCIIAREFLQSQSLDIKDIDIVCDIINYVSKRPSGNHMSKSKEAMCVSDANTLDAIGVIGIARAISWGAVNGQILYDGDLHGDSTIKAFYDKLLPLSSNMKTDSGREMAIDRTDKINDFLQQFYYEWNL